MNTQQRPKKYFSRYKESMIEMPNLIESQIKSFEWLKTFGLAETFKEFSAP